MYLVDTNIWLERLLNQERSDDVGDFLSKTPSNHLCMTDFAFHSIMVILTKLQKTDVLLQFTQDTLIDGEVFSCPPVARRYGRVDRSGEEVRFGC